MLFLLVGEDPLALHNGYRGAHQSTGALTYNLQLEVRIIRKAQGPMFWHFKFLMPLMILAHHVWLPSSKKFYFAPTTASFAGSSPELGKQPSLNVLLLSLRSRRKHGIR